MKRINMFIVVMAVVIFSGSALGADRQNNGPWKLIAESKISHKSTIAGFRDGLNGMTAGYSGECHYTSDGGKNWPLGMNSSACRFGLEIVNDKVAWTCGNHGHVRLSTDGGVSWIPVSDFGKTEPLQCRYLSFIDDKTGWIASPYGMMAMTQNGGETWESLKLPEGMDSIAALSLRTKDDGYILDMSGLIYRTNDGGKTWSTLESGFKDATMLMKLSAPQEAMRFIDEMRGIIVACLDDGKVYASVTVDGGKSWKREAIPATMGVLFLTHDGQRLTVSQGSIIRVYQRSSL